MRTLILLALLSLAVPVSAQGQDTVPAHGQAAAGAVVVQPGDMVRLLVYREGDLNGEYLVDENGYATFPLIGRQRLAGLGFDALREHLIREFQLHLRNPSITVTPLRRVNVIGEVQRPNLYAVDPTVSLVGAVALAGGATPEGDLRRIRIIRNGQVIRDRVGEAETISGANILSGDQIVVDRRSWMDRNSDVVVSTLLAIPSLVSTIILIARN
jgi:protein involved in polysaccharide export with SLBB domain